MGITAKPFLQGFSYKWLYRGAFLKALLPVASKGQSASALSIRGEQIPNAVLRQLQQILSLPPSSTLMEAAVSENEAVRSVTYQLTYSGIPVADRTLSLDYDRRTGNLLLVRSTLPTVLPESSAPLLDSTGLYLQLQKIAGENLEVVKPPTPVYYATDSSLLLAYRATIRSTYSPLQLTIGRNGELLESKDLTNYFSSGHPTTIAHGNGEIAIHPSKPSDTLTPKPFSYGWIVSNGKSVLTDSLGNWRLNIDTSLITTSLQGKYARVHRRDNFPDALLTLSPGDSLSFLWNDDNSHAAERDTYVAITALASHLRAIDPAITRLDSGILANVNEQSNCNASYDPSTLELHFFQAGSGCANTGEITDVIDHEFGHHITHCRYWDTPSGNIIDGSLSEGFSDITSAFMRDDPRIGIELRGAGQVLRNCDNTLTIPSNISIDIHVNGSIISGAFWDLRKKIGLAKTEHLFHYMQYLHPDGIDRISYDAIKDAFVNVLLATILTDDNDGNLTNGTPNLASILSAFALHNIRLESEIAFEATQLPNQTGIESNYPVEIRLHNFLASFEIAPDSITLFYSVNGKPYQAVAASKIGDHFLAIIPKQDSNSWVRYYVSAPVSLLNTTLTSPPSFEPPYGFIVGYRSVWNDDVEQDRHWSFATSDDDATTGRWSRDIPFGTFEDSIDFVQQDTDHTASGNYCFLTGNANKKNNSHDIGEDDVDQGKTTLTSPALSLEGLHDPVLTYWYYYTNDQGQHPGAPLWLVQTSLNGGLTWETIDTSRNSTAGWRKRDFPINAASSITHSLMVRFVASDYTSSVVEAGVDDVELWDHNGASPFERISLKQPAATTISVYPNPIHGTATLRYTVASYGRIQILVKDVLGRVVERIIDAERKSGTYTTSFQLSNELPNGSYYIEAMTAAGYTVTKFNVQR